MDELEKKLKEALEIQKRIEEKMKFLEEHGEDLSDSQLEDLANLAVSFEEKLFPEINEIKKEMEEKKQSAIQKNSESSDNNLTEKN